MEYRYRLRLWHRLPWLIPPLLLGAALLFAFWQATMVERDAGRQAACAVALLVLAAAVPRFLAVGDVTMSSAEVSVRSFFKSNTLRWEDIEGVYVDGKLKSPSYISTSHLVVELTAPDRSVAIYLRHYPHNRNLLRHIVDFLPPKLKNQPGEE